MLVTDTQQPGEGGHHTHAKHTRIALGNRGDNQGLWEAGFVVVRK